jgi:predicted metal-binding membrane protein
MAVLLVVGVMDLPLMALLTVAMTIERLAPTAKYVARVIGAIAVAAGLILVAETILITPID